MNARKTRQILLILALLTALTVLLASCLGDDTPAETTLPATSAVAEPTEAPTEVPTEAPTAEPTAIPTAAPTVTSTVSPTAAPTAVPTAAPTATPTAAPTATPTAAPTATPTAAPTAAPTATPTDAPTEAPTAEPTEPITEAPTEAPTAAPTDPITEAPTEPVTEAPTEPIVEPPVDPAGEAVEYRIGLIAQPELTEDGLLFILSPDGTGTLTGPFDNPAEYSREELENLGFHGTRMVLTPYLAYIGPVSVEDDLAALTFEQALMRIDVEGDVPDEEIIGFFSAMGEMAREAAEQLLSGGFVDAALIDPEVGAMRGTVTFRLSEELKIAELVRTMMFTEEGRYLIQEIDEDGWVTEIEYNADGTVYDGIIYEYSDDGKLRKRTVISDGEIESVTEFYPNEAPKTETRYYWHGGWAVTEYAENGNPISWIKYYSDGSVSRKTEYFPDGTERSETEYGPGGILLSHYENFEDGNYAVIDRYYDNGTPERHTEYFPNGEIKVVTEWNESGQLRSRHEYTEDGYTLRLEEYFPNGNLEYIFFAGSETEPPREEEYDETGRLVLESKFEFVGDDTVRTTRRYDADVDGYSVTETRFGANGKVIRETGYNTNGKIAWMREYDPVTGNPVAEEYYDDGVLYSRDSFDENGNRTVSEYYESDGSMTRETFNENGDTAKRYKYYSDGSYDVSEYNGFWRSSALSEYAADGTLKSRTEYEYDENGYDLEERRYDSGGKLTERTVYTHSADGLSRSYVTFDGEGNLEESYEWIDDEEHRTLREVWIDGSGKIRRGDEYEYDGNDLVKEIFYAPYHYVVTEYYVPSGNIKSETRYNTENDAVISHTEYDENGNVTKQVNNG